MGNQEDRQKHQLEEINKKEAKNILKLYPHKFNSQIFNTFLTKNVNNGGVAYNKEEYFRALVGAGSSIVGVAIITSMITGAYKIQEIGKYEDIFKFASVTCLGIFSLLLIDFLNLAKIHYEEYENSLLKWDKLDWIEYRSRLLNRNEKLNLMKVISNEFKSLQRVKKIEGLKNKIKVFSSKTRI